MAKLLIHIGEGDERKTYEYEREKLLNVEAIAIEKATGLSWLDFEQGLSRLSMAAVTGLVWVLRKRAEPWLNYEDVQFSVMDLATDFIDDEEAPEVPKAPKPKRKPVASVDDEEAPEVPKDPS